MSEDPASSKQPAGASRPHQGGRRTVLVVANEELAGDAVHAVAREIRRAGVNGDPPAVRVVSPVLATSPIKHQMNDIDEAMGPADERLQGSLQALRSEGLEASGQIGDADPLQAIKDELLKRDVDRILIVSHERDDESAYAEKRLLERVEREVGPPATELRVAGHDREEHVVDRRQAHAGATRGEEGWRISANLPPLRPMDAAGIFVAVFGTIALIILAGTCSDVAHEEGGGAGTLAGDCILRYLLAGAFFLINIAHVAGLLLMSSVNYYGPFERFIARISLFGTPIAVLVSVLVVA